MQNQQLSEILRIRLDYYMQEKARLDDKIEDYEGCDENSGGGMSNYDYYYAQLRELKNNYSDCIKYLKYNPGYTAANQAGGNSCAHRGATPSHHSQQEGTTSIFLKEYMYPLRKHLLRNYSQTKCLKKSV